MADLAAKREARRRKILENSENRINKLLGKPQSLQNDDQQTEGVTEDAVEVKSDGSLPLTSKVADPNSAGDAMTHVPAKDATSLLSDSAVSSRPPLSSVRESESTTSATTVASGTPEHRLHSPQEKQKLLKILDNLRLTGCFFIAFFVQWVMSTGYGILYFKTIFLPFTLLEVGLYTFHYTYMKEIALPHTSTLLSGALMLCGLRPNVIVVYNTVMGYATAVTEDFAIYLFAFIVFNAAMA